MKVKVWRLGGSVDVDRIVETVLKAAGKARLLPLFGRRSVPFKLEAELPQPVPLRVVVRDSGLRIVQSGGGRLVARGRTSDLANVRFRLVEEGDGRLVGELTVSEADAVVEAPFTALGVVADSSGVRVSAGGEPLRYASFRADSSGLTVEARIARGGGLYAVLDSSALRATLTPEGPGEYWVELEADSSGVKVEFAGEKAYNLEESQTIDSNVRIEPRGGRAPVRVKVRVRADSSSIKLV